MPAPVEVQTATLNRFLEVWKAWKPAEFLDLCDDDFVQVTLPYSLQVPTRNLKEVRQALPHLMEVVKDYTFDVEGVVQDVSKSKAAFYATATGQTQWGPWKMEYAMYLTFNEAGDKISRKEEMLDAEQYKAFAPTFGAYMRETMSRQAV